MFLCAARRGVCSSVLLGEVCSSVLLGEVCSSVLLGEVCVPLYC